MFKLVDFVVCRTPGFSSAPTCRRGPPTPAHTRSGRRARPARRWAGGSGSATGSDDVFRAGWAASRRGTWKSLRPPATSDADDVAASRAIPFFEHDDHGNLRVVRGVLSRRSFSCNGGNRRLYRSGQSFRKGRRSQASTHLQSQARAINPTRLKTLLGWHRMSNSACDFT